MCVRARVCVCVLCIAPLHCILGLVQTRSSSGGRRRACSWSREDGRPRLRAGHDGKSWLLNAAMIMIKGGICPVRSQSRGSHLGVCEAARCGVQSYAPSPFLCTFQIRSCSDTGHTVWGASFHQTHTSRCCVPFPKTNQIDFERGPSGTSPHPGEARQLWQSRTKGIGSLYLVLAIAASQHLFSYFHQPCISRPKT